MDIALLKKDSVFQKTLRGVDLTFHSTWGLFSPKAIDEGSELLIENIKLHDQKALLDIGCGYGAIGITLAKLLPMSTVHMVDRDFVAVEYAQKNAEVNNVKNCKIYLSNGFNNVTQQFDTIVSNIPAKVGKELYWILIHDAYEHLTVGGSLYFVFISHLKEFFKRNFKETFGNYEAVATNKTYTVAKAVKS